MADNWRQDAHDEELRKFDSYAHAITVISEPHRMIHDGFYFDSSGIKLDLAAGATFDIMLKFPAGEIGHMTIVEFTIEDAPVLLRFYEGVTVTDDGTPANVRNHNRVKAIDTATAIVAIDPTVTDIGTILHERYIPAAGAPGQQAAGRLVTGEDSEWVLGNPTEERVYMWRLTNNTGKSIDLGFHLNGYQIGYVD